MWCCRWRRECPRSRRACVDGLGGHCVYMPRVDGCSTAQRNPPIAIEQSKIVVPRHALSMSFTYAVLLDVPSKDQLDWSRSDCASRSPPKSIEASWLLIFLAEKCRPDQHMVSAWSAKETRLEIGLETRKGMRKQGWYLRSNQSSRPATFTMHRLARA